MLVLSRRISEKIRIEVSPGTYVWISILDVDYGKVRIGVHAPPEMVILRDELLYRDDHRERGG